MPSCDLQNAALVIAGHGSTRNPDSSSPTRLHAEEIQRRGIFSEVVCGFWKEEPSYREALRMVESRDIFVVPNFISEGHFTRTVIPREMELDGPVTRRGGRTIRYCEPAGSHPGMTDLLLAEALAISHGAPPSETSLLIVGHGTRLNDYSAAAAKLQAVRIAETGRYAEVCAAYMEEPPLIKEWDTITSQPNVVVVPFFISDGLHSYQDIPVLLGLAKEPGKAASQSEVFKHNPHRLRGRRLFYGSAIGTDPGFADIILDQVAAFQKILR
jgi:sirohydrochlorin cobaltochelatase